MTQNKILIVDDNSDEALLISEYLNLSSIQHESHIANNVEDAYKLTIELKPDLIISDWEMPETSGIDFLYQLSTNEATSQIPVIIVTGRMLTSNNLKTAFMKGASDYIRKPVDIIELEARVKSVLTAQSYLHKIKNISNKLAEQNQQLAESNERFEALSQATFEGIVIHNETTILDANENILELTGFSKDELINNSIFKLISETEFLDINNHKHDETRVMRKTGRSFAAEISSKQLPYHSKVCQVLAINDITHRKEREEMILEQERMILSQENELLYKELEFSRKEIVSKAMHIANLFEKTNKSLMELSQINKTVKDKEVLEHVDNIIKKLSFSLNKQEQWEEFEIHFEKVHNGFYEKLNEKFDNLTPGERKLCAFLRLNLSTKEISSLTYQNQQTINIARSRLRKKLNLSREENLVTFLSNLDK